MFDPGAGEVPEHLEVYPPGKPFPWRHVVLSVATSAVVVMALDGCEEFRNRQAEPGPLVVVEGAPLDLVCEESQQLRALYEVAPCDEESMTSVGIEGTAGYYIAFAVRVRDDGQLTGRRPYLLRSDCIMDRHGVLSPVDPCVVVSLE